MKWQQNDSAHDLSLQSTVDHLNHNPNGSSSPSSGGNGSPSPNAGVSTSQNSTNRRKIVSFCKYLCRIFDSSVNPILFENDSSENNSQQQQEQQQLVVLSLMDETTLLLEYKSRLLCFMNRLMQRYGKRAVECFLGSSAFKPPASASSSSPSSSRRHSSSIGFKLVCPPLFHSSSSSRDLSYLATLNLLLWDHDRFSLQSAVSVSLRSKLWKGILKRKTKESLVSLVGKDNLNSF
jgi:hypothetical protein